MKAIRHIVVRYGLVIVVALVLVFGLPLLGSRMRAISSHDEELAKSLPVPVAHITNKEKTLLKSSTGSVLAVTESDGFYIATVSVDGDPDAKPFVWSAQVLKIGDKVIFHRLILNRANNAGHMVYQNSILVVSKINGTPTGAQSGPK